MIRKWHQFTSVVFKTWRFLVRDETIQVDKNRHRRCRRNFRTKTHETNYKPNSLSYLSRLYLNNQQNDACIDKHYNGF